MSSESDQTQSYLSSSPTGEGDDADRRPANVVNAPLLQALNSPQLLLSPVLTTIYKYYNADTHNALRSLAVADHYTTLDANWSSFQLHLSKDNRVPVENMSGIISVTATAPVNIATIKYWGKRDEKLILPLNDSISVTLSSRYMHAKTTVAISPSFEKDRVWLNGKEESIENSRLQNCLRNIRSRSKISDEKLKWKIRICSENNFPTAAGLASSSAGYACLVYGLSQLYEITGDISAIARQGSGSACRSVYGGFVRWHAGIESDGSDSIATQIAPVSHWPELKIIILVVNDKQKKISSTTGMQRTTKTSHLFQYRIESTVPNHITQMIKAIEEKDFDKFAEITMRDSNQLHAVCLDTFPPAVYMNDVSHAISSFVHEYNDVMGTSKVAYTFDAGPNACLFVRDQDVHSLISTILRVFPPSGTVADYLRGIPVNLSKQIENVPTINTPVQKDALKYIICTEVGDGPELVSQDASLLNEHGIPLNITT